MQPAEIAAWANQVRSASNGAFQINLWIPDPAPKRDAEHAQHKLERDFCDARKRRSILRGPKLLAKQRRNKLLLRGRSVGAPDEALRQIMFVLRWRSGARTLSGTAWTHRADACSCTERRRAPTNAGLGWSVSGPS